MAKRRARRVWLVGGLAVAGGVVLTGCSPANRNALTRIDGLPAVENCGGWIDEVEVRDADTDRLVWMARQTAVSTGYDYYSVGLVRLGELPNDGWTTVGEFQPLPHPARWEFRLDGGTEVLVAADSDLVEGVYLVDGRSLTLDQFRNDICEEDGGPLIDLARVLVLGLAAIVVVVLIATATWAVVWSRGNRKRPVGWHQRDGIWRWWNGSGWQ